jgi:hypothetical protein
MGRKPDRATTLKTGAPSGLMKTVDQWQVFLDALTEKPNVSEACGAAGIARVTAYDRKRSDPEFAALWDVAFDLGYNKAEEEAYRRAVHGVPRKVYYKGRAVAAKDPITGKRQEVTVLEYSDTLLAMVLKGRKRSVFGDKAEVVMSGHKHDKQSLTDEELDALIAEWLGS